jgi:hypothetical protein
MITKARILSLLKACLFLTEAEIYKHYGHERLTGRYPFIGLVRSGDLASYTLKNHAGRMVKYYCLRSKRGLIEGFCQEKRLFIVDKREFVESKKPLLLLPPLRYFGVGKRIYARKPKRKVMTTEERRANKKAQDLAWYYKNKEKVLGYQRQRSQEINNRHKHMQPEELIQLVRV